MKIEDLKAILKGDLSRIRKVNVKDVSRFKDRIAVCPCDVQNMLDKFLASDILPEELCRWAKFLTSRGEYVCPDTEANQEEDYYETMWHVVQRLSTPEIDGEIDARRVSQYRSELEKYLE